MPSLSYASLFRYPPVVLMKPLLCAGALAVLTTGCVSSQRYAPNASWPKPIVATSITQFEGVFRNGSFDIDQTEQAAKNSNKLFSYLAHRLTRDGADRVEIRAAAHGNQLNVRVLNQQNEEIDSATLQRGIDFKFSDGRLILYGPYSGVRSLNSNFGPGLILTRSRLYVSEKGDLLGSTSQNYVMLVMMLIPGVSTAKFWDFWPKIAK